MSATTQTTKNQVICCCFKKKVKETVPVSVHFEHAASDAQTAKVPFATDLPLDLRAGTIICVNATVLPKCTRFAVNLTCGRSPQADVAFHLNPRLLQRYVVRNSRLNGQWGDEERASTVKFPFGRNNSNFVLVILIAEEEFYVAVDGVHICNYKFRVSLEKVSGIEIQGNVDVVGVGWNLVRHYPESLDDISAVQVGKEHPKSEESSIKTGKDTPATFLLPGGFQRDCQLEIYGRVKILPHSFYVNLQEGTHRWPHPTIPLHMNQRFQTPSGEPIFVRNAWIDKGWGQEECSPGCKFEPGSPFTMAIRRGSDHFSVWIEGKLSGEFKFRGKVDHIDSVHIDGDVVIFDVRLQIEKNELAPLKVAG